MQSGTARIFPDWRQEITTIRGGDDWAVFEWIGRATYAGIGADDPPAGTEIEMHGATIVEVDARRSRHVVARLPRPQGARGAAAARGQGGPNDPLLIVPTSTRNCGRRSASS